MWLKWNRLSVPAGEKTARRKPYEFHHLRHGCRMRYLPISQSFRLSSSRCPAPILHRTQTAKMTPLAGPVLMLVFTVLACGLPAEGSTNSSATSEGEACAPASVCSASNHFFAYNTHCMVKLALGNVSRCTNVLISLCVSPKRRGTIARVVVDSVHSYANDDGRLMQMNVYFVSLNRFIYS